MLSSLLGWGRPQIPVPYNSSSACIPIRIITQNIRYATKDLFTNERPWSERLPLILSQLRYHTRFLTNASFSLHSSAATSLICLQEVLHSQLHDILSGLNTLPPSTTSTSLPSGAIWSHIGVGRDDGHEAGEYSPLLYSTATFKLLHFETVWLSPTPTVPSRGWDAGSIRILTIGVLLHKATQKRMLGCVTHLDNAGAKARVESVKVILAAIERIGKAWKEEEELPVFLAGDFNSKPDDEAYLLMERSGLLADLRGFVEEQDRYGEVDTFTGFGNKEEEEDRGRIDFIWLGPKDRIRRSDGKAEERKWSWRVNGYAVLPNRFEDGAYCSDHRAVVGDVELRI